MRTHIALLAIAVSCSVAGCGREPPQPAVPAPGATQQTIMELQSTDMVVGAGPAIAQGQEAVVHYTGWLYDSVATDNKGTEFDSSRKRGEPFRFTIGAGGVIQGWERGVVGMQVGGQRRLIIPPALGYGERGGGNVIPPNATLLFEIELLAIEQPKQ